MGGVTKCDRTPWFSNESIYQSDPAEKTGLDGYSDTEAVPFRGQAGRIIVIMRWY